MSGPLSPEELRKMNAYWRAANYLSVGQIYLYDNPLLSEPLRPEHIKPRLLGHWGTTPGLNFVYVHLNRLINSSWTSIIIYVCGPGHGGPGMVANTYLEGTYSEFLPQHHPKTRRDEAPVQAVFLPRRHSQPRRARRLPGRSTKAVSSVIRCCTPTGAVFDNPEPDRLLRDRRWRSRNRDRWPGVGIRTNF
jgi:xylulose-5-phosphate/fructose-6-phosphate phosphoketolase